MTQASHRVDADMDVSSQLSPSEAGSLRNPTSSQALNAKRLRMLAENDVQFLANRIAKLKAEEDKARKEIDRTIKKTNEILATRTSYESRAVDELQIREQTINSKKEERVLMSLNREKQLKALWVAKQKMLNDKKEMVQGMRKEKDINECRVHIMKQESREKNSKRREEIQKEQMCAKMRREKEMQQKQEEARQRYAEAVANEEQEREMKERLAAELVQQEAQYIYRLKRLHEEKQKALKDLAAAVDVTRSDVIEEDIQAEHEEEPQEVEEDIS